jgi:hypothetical protein
MKKHIVFLFGILILIGAYFALEEINNNKKLNSILTFDNEHIRKIWAFQGVKGLSYDYKVNADIINDISSELIQSNKKGAKKLLPSPYNQGFVFIIFLNNDNNVLTNEEINIIPKNDNSVVVVIKTTNKHGAILDSWALSVESTWLSQYISKVEKEFASL